MGKRYYCDYCKKAMVATPAIVKTHNNGIVHQKLVQDHYQQFKDPETVLAEESKKKPCARFSNGQCQFGSICRFTHYTKDELNALKKKVSVRSRKASKSKGPKTSFIDLVHNMLSQKSTKAEESLDGDTMIYDKNGITHVFPWTYNPIFDSYGESLPPSLKRFKVEDFSNAKIVEWG